MLAGYAALARFLGFFGVFVAVVLLRNAEASTGAAISATVADALFPPAFRDASGAVVGTFASAAAIYAWLDAFVAGVFVPPVCGRRCGRLRSSRLDAGRRRRLARARALAVLHGLLVADDDVEVRSASTTRSRRRVPRGRVGGAFGYLNSDARTRHADVTRSRAGTCARATRGVRLLPRCASSTATSSSPGCRTAPWAQPQQRVDQAASSRRTWATGVRVRSKA